MWGGGGSTVTVHVPCALCPGFHVPGPSFYLPEYRPTSYSDWLHHNNLIYIVILNYIGLYCPVNNKIGLDNNPMGVCCIALYS